MSLLKRLGEARAVVVTGRASLATSLAAIALANIWRHESPSRMLVYELSPLHRPTIENALQATGVGAEVVYVGLDDTPGLYPSVVVGVGAEPSRVEKAYRIVGRAGRVWIVSANRGLSLKLQYPLVRITVAPGGDLVARLGRGPGARVRITPYGVDEAPPPPGERRLRAVRDALLDAMVEYGSLTVRDAVNIIMAREGVDRARAREILGELAERGLIRVRKGLLEL